MRGDFSMQKLITVLVVPALLTLATPALAQKPGKPAGLRETAKSGETMKGLRVGFINAQKAILDTNEGKAARDAIDKDAKKKHEELARDEQELKRLSDDFQAQFAVMPDGTKAEKQKELQKKYEAFQRARMEFEQMFRDREQQETGKILNKMLLILDEYSKKNGFDFVFEQGTGALLYASKIEDITAEIVSEYNKKHKK
jgi:outer membrane protein